jgi:hypothetical protein
MMKHHQQASGKTAMLIATTEGQGWRYEVIAQSDGFLVQPRDLETGELAIEDSTLFRTSPAALAYADMVAAADRYAGASFKDEFDETLAGDLARERDRFAAIRVRLCDDGISGDILLRRRDIADTIERARYH